MLTLSMLLGSCSWMKNPADPVVPKETGSNTPGAPTNTGTQVPTPTPSSAGGPDAAEEILAQMTLEEKIGQMFFIGSRKNAAGQRQLALDEPLKKVLTQFQPGGFIFFAENLDTISQTTAFIEELQKDAKIPLFIGIDEEGGTVTRLNKAEKLHSTVMPEPYTIGSTGNSEYAFMAAKAIGEELKSLGFNLNFAPVADVFSNPKNKIIGRRAYSEDPSVVSEMVAQAVKGTKESGIIPVLKHFPGHGDTLEDSHTGAAEQLKKAELLPFCSGIEAGAEMVMMGHLMTPEITDNGLPATLSRSIVEGVLREQLGFDGVIITDGLEMSAITAFYSEEEAVVMAVEAGIDILLLPNDFSKAYNAVLTAVMDGRISEERIDESVIRILALKLRAISGKPTQAPETVLGSPEHQQLAERIREEARP